MAHYIIRVAHDIIANNTGVLLWDGGFLKRLSALFIVMVILTAIGAQTVSASAPLPQYVYEDAERELPFDISTDKLKSADSHEKALRLFEDTITGLKASEKRIPYVIDALALLAEECIRYGGQDDPESLRRDILNLASQNDVEFIRELRLSINISTNEKNQLDFNTLEVPRSNAEFLYVETQFAALRLNMRDAGSLNSVSMQRSGVIEEIVDEDEEIEEDSPASASTFTVISTVQKFWSIYAALVVILVSILVEPLRRRKETRWAVLALCIILYGINAAFVISASAYAPQNQNQIQSNTQSQSQRQSQERVSTPVEDEGIVVTLAGNMVATLSFPLEDEKDKDLTVVDSGGAPVPCKYNPITHMIDAIITKNDTYSLKLSAVYFTDIEDKSAEMQYAIRILTSRGLMTGADERSFLPDREITRAEFIAVITGVMNIIDQNADNPFPDVLRSDWFYFAAVSAYKEGLIDGYDDGTFRGNTPIPKVQMATIIASALIRMMRYDIPTPGVSAQILNSTYSDDKKIADWAQQNVALATRAGIVPERDDGAFDSGSVMTRGDAAVMLYRLFNAIW